MKSLPKIALAVLLAAAATLAGMWLARSRAPTPAAAPLVLQHATLFGTPRAMPDFSLLDQSGQPFGPAQMKGHWNILFFGYTHCPDICPTTLATLAAAHRQLSGLPPADQPQVVFLSVDPKRDTPQHMAEYVKFFDPSFIGVTGEPAAVEALTKALGVAVVFNKPDASGNYTVAHTATLFLVDPAGNVAGIFSTPHTPDGIAHDYRLILQHVAQGSG